MEVRIKVTSTGAGPRGGRYVKHRANFIPLNQIERMMYGKFTSWTLDRDEESYWLVLEASEKRSQGGVSIVATVPCNVCGEPIPVSQEDIDKAFKDLHHTGCEILTCPACRVQLKRTKSMPRLWYRCQGCLTYYKKTLDGILVKI